MDHNEYIKRILKHFTPSTNLGLYNKEYLGCTISKMKKVKDIEEQKSESNDDQKDFEWSAISNMIKAGGFIKKLKD